METINSAKPPQWAKTTSLRTRRCVNSTVDARPFCCFERHARRARREPFPGLGRPRDRQRRRRRGRRAARGGARGDPGVLRIAQPRRPARSRSALEPARSRARAAARRRRDRRFRFRSRACGAPRRATLSARGRAPRLPLRSQSILAALPRCRARGHLAPPNRRSKPLRHSPISRSSTRTRSA